MNTRTQREISRNIPRNIKGLRLSKGKGRSNGSVISKDGSNDHINYHGSDKGSANNKDAGNSYDYGNNKTKIHQSDDIVPLLTAYGCVLIERDAGKSYIYTAVNIKTGYREVISRRSTPLTTSGVDVMVEKICLSKVAGAGRFEADRPLDEKAALEKCREILNVVFKEVLPQHGYNVRKEQLSLSHHILEATSRRLISLAEAGVGTGKTFAYLIPAIIAKRARLNGYWNMSFHTGSPYVDMAHMPIVIATSSIALQKAIVTEAIPKLSHMLMEHGIIKQPLTAVIRKGREHYVCEKKLRTHIPFERDPDVREILESLLRPSAPIDLAEVDGLTPYVKRRISVADRCDKNCPNRENCAYLRFREQASSSDIDIQVCNHNYLLADTMRRANGQRPLIPNYQMIIIDEAHKFLQAARSMYGVELSISNIIQIEDLAHSLNFKNKQAHDEIHHAAKVLADQGCRLFRRFEDRVKIRTEEQSAEDEQTRFSVDIDADSIRNLRNIRDLSERLMELLHTEPLTNSGAGRRAQLLWELQQVHKQVSILVQHEKLINWIEIENQDCCLCAIPKDLEKRLYDDLWSKGIPIILTSGTLSTSGSLSVSGTPLTSGTPPESAALSASGTLSVSGTLSLSASTSGILSASDTLPTSGTPYAVGNFTHIKRTLGIARVSKHRISKTSKPSPFNYYENSMLYISENMPFPNQRDSNYILAVANEVEQLVRASHGHAAVLFTSYKAMDMVWEHIEERALPYPMFRMDKGGIREIDKFKSSGNGILFASGAMWEGIDIPGDALSMLIIVKLPFAVPDPISEYEQTLYASMSEYKEFVILPEMLIKTKQGHGRLIRIETDAGVVAILDCRVALDGPYRDVIMEALPHCHVTDSIADVELMYLNVKGEEYFVKLGA